MIIRFADLQRAMIGLQPEALLSGVRVGQDGCTTIHTQGAREVNGNIIYPFFPFFLFGTKAITTRRNTQTDGQIDIDIDRERDRKEKSNF